MFSLASAKAQAGGISSRNSKMSGSKHAYLQAQQLFISGRIPVSQVVGMMLSMLFDLAGVPYEV